SSAAAMIGRSSNCASASPVKAISVTRNREKCTDTPGRPASIAAVTGSSVVLDDGVSMPRRIGAVMPAASHGGDLKANHLSHDAFQDRQPTRRRKGIAMPNATDNNHDKALKDS